MRGSTVLLFVMCFVLGWTVSVASQPTGPHHDLKDPSHWWDAACCNQKDCRPAREGEVEPMINGYKVYLPGGAHTFVHFNDTRLKKKPINNPYAFDGLFHVCIIRDYVGGFHLNCLYEREQIG